VHVTFKQNKFQAMSQACAEGTKIDRVESDGKVVYRQVCHDTGLVWVDQTPRPRTVPAALAAGLRPGRTGLFYNVHTTPAQRRSKQPRDKLSIPIVVFADPRGKRMVACYGMSLE
jgi:hypothetical protein